MGVTTNIGFLKDALKTSQDENARLSTEIERARAILAGTAVGSLPNDYPLSKLALETWNTLQDRTLEGLALIGRIEELVEALRDAMTCIKVFHGPTAWDIYEKQSPEMKRFHAILAKVQS